MSFSTFDHQKLKAIADNIKSRKYSNSMIENVQTFTELLIISLSSNKPKYEKLKEHHNEIVR